MALGEKLFEESGNVQGFKVAKVHPVEGTTMGSKLYLRDKGLWQISKWQKYWTLCYHQYPREVVDVSHQAMMMMTTAKEGEQFIWWAHEKSRLEDDRKIKGRVIVSGFTKSEKLSQMNRLIMILESEFDPASQQFRITAYEWR